MKDHFVPATIGPGDEEAVFPTGLTSGSTCQSHVFTAGGKVLYTRAWGIGLVQLKSALEKFQAEEDPKIPARSAKAQKDWDSRPKPPEGGMVLYVTWKIVAGFDKPLNREQEMFQKALGVDRLWVRKDEADALAKGELPKSLQTRMLNYGLWMRKAEVKKWELTLREGVLSGTVHSEVKGGYRSGYEPEILGFIEAKDGKVTRFDVVARGPWWHSKPTDGRYRESNIGGFLLAPFDRKVTLAVTFTLADPNENLAKVPPAAFGQSTYLGD